MGAKHFSFGPFPFLGDGMADTKLILGGVVFRDFEIPEEISYGLEHRLEQHRLVGGARVTDAMGPDHAPIHWRGHFRGKDAISRAKKCERLVASGAQVSLSFGGLHWQVVAQKFEANYQRFYEIPYTISCEVTSSGFGGGFISTLTSLISADVSVISGLVGRL